MFAATADPGVVDVTEGGRGGGKSCAEEAAVQRRGEEECQGGDRQPAPNSAQVSVVYIPTTQVSRPRLTTQACAVQTLITPGTFG